jgi:hypothetical protein
MTASRGRFLPFTRHGMQSNNMSPLDRAAFERTAVVCMDAAAAGVRDAASSMTACVVLGKEGDSTGTGSVVLLHNAGAEASYLEELRRTEASTEVTTGDWDADETYCAPPMPFRSHATDPEPRRAPPAQRFTRPWSPALPPKPADTYVPYSPPLHQWQAPVPWPVAEPPAARASPDAEMVDADDW